MNSAIFRTATESYQVSQIAYVGPVGEIPEDRRKGESTHSFKVITSVNPVYCYYKSLDSAKNARGAVGAMFNEVKPYSFKHGYEIIDTKRVVSVSNVFALKKVQDDLTHAFCVILDSRNEKNNRIWLRYKSEDNAKKGRNALFASIHSVNNTTPAAEEEPAEGEAVIES